MSEFFRYPSTPHLAWLSDAPLRGDKLLDSHAVDRLLRGEVVVEEKVDGANLGLSLDEGGRVRAQNRGAHLAPGGHHQWGPLWPWLDARRSVLEQMPQDLIVFGEWCFARHTIAYDALPDWFLGFDVWDRVEQNFWSTMRRDGLLSELGLCAVPRRGEGRFGLAQLEYMVGEGASMLGAPLAEGVVVRRDEGGFLLEKAKLVRPEFLAAIDEHWTARELVPNRIVG